MPKNLLLRLLTNSFLLSPEPVGAQKPAPQTQTEEAPEAALQGGWIMTGDLYMESRGLPNQLFFTKDGRGAYCGVTAAYSINAGKLLISSMFGSFLYIYALENGGKQLVLTIGGETVRMERIEN